MRNFPAVTAVRAGLGDEDVLKAQDTFIHPRTPAWIRQASPDEISELRTLFAGHKASQAAVQAATGAAMPIHEFAAKLLSEGLADLLPSDHTLDTLDWQDKVLKVEGVSVPYAEYEYPTRPGLLRLMQNFAQGVTPLDGSGLVVPGTTTVVSGDLDTLIARCRRLDAGRQYQALLHDTFIQNKALLINDKLQGFKLAVQVAYLKKAIGRDIKDALEHYVRIEAGEQPLADGPAPALTAYPGLLSMLGVPVHEALFVQLRGADDSDGGIVAYLPGDAHEPVRWYASKLAWNMELADQLRNAGYLGTFMHLVALKDRIGFFATLQSRLKDAVPDLQVEGESGEGHVFQRWVQAQLQRAQEDARLLLVPTAEADLKASRERLESWKTMAWTAANLAGFFIPVVGAVLLAQMVAQVVAQLFEGVQDWAAGHDHEAVEHVLNVAQTVAAAALVTGVAAGSGAVIRRFTRSAFVDGLEVVVGEDGSQRLWNEDRSLYETDATGALLADDGLYTQGEQRWVRVDGRYYQVRQDAEDGPWRLVHPGRPSAYGPVVERNAERCWRLRDEAPEAWNDAQRMLDRLWPQQQPLSAVRAQQVLQAACSDVDELRGLLLENRALPANLRYTLRCFEADARVERFFASVAVDGSALEDHLLLEACKQALQHSDPGSLVQAIREQAPLLRSRLYQLLSHVEAPVDPVAQVIQRDFPGLAAEYAEQLANTVTPQQREEIELLRRLPLAVMTQARSLLQLARLNRAQQGLMLRNAYDDATGEVMMVLLERLDNWSFDRRLELRAGSSLGRLLAVLNAQSRYDTQWVLAHGDGAFRVYDHRGILLDGQGSEPDDLFKVITGMLTEQQRTRLGLGSIDQAAKLRQLVVAQLPVSRSKLLARFGWAQEPAWFNPGQRLPDGRVGYPLGGAVSRQRGSLRRLRDRLARLYHGASPRQIDEHVSRLLDSEDPFEVLAFEEHNFEQLEGKLDAWVDQATELEKPSRRQLSRLLRRAWRRQLPVDRELDRVNCFLLDLSGCQVTSLPRLDSRIDFQHVTSLVMVNTPLHTVPDEFLSCFTNLRRLNLARNRLRELPGGIRQLRLLERLQLSHNWVVFDEQAGAALAELTRLELLNLSVNPLRILSLNFIQAPALARLELRHCSLLGWPAGLENCGLLRHVDLRSNALTSVPDVIMAMPYPFRSTIHLEGNFIPVEQLARMRARPPHLAHDTVRLGAALSARATWVGEEMAAERGPRWQRLFAGRENEQLLALLSELQFTADFRNLLYRPVLAERVWELLDAMDTDADLAQDIRSMVLENTTCDDSVAERFSDLHLQALVSKAKRNVAGQKDALLTLGKGLFRLDRLKAFIRSDIDLRLLEDPGLDQIEASLYYLVSLAKELQLPAQPSSMKYAALGRVSEVKLQAARDYVKAAETIPAQARFLSELGFWSKWLEHTYEDDFSSINDRFAIQGNELDEQRDRLPDAQYKVQWDALAWERNAELLRLKVLLSTQVLETEEGSSPA